MAFRKLSLFFLLSLAPTTLFAQAPVQLEFTAFSGLPMNDVVKSNICCGPASVLSSERIHAPSYLAGASAGVLLHDRIRIDFGVTYMPFSWETTLFCCSSNSPTTTVSHGKAWELPLLAAYRWKHGPIRPFAGGGFLVHTTMSSSSPLESHPGPVARGGFDWEFGRFAIRNEFRYLYFPQTASSTNQSVGRPRNQMEVLLGLTFRMSGVR